MGSTEVILNSCTCICFRNENTEESTNVWIMWNGPWTVLPKTRSRTPLRNILSVKLSLFVWYFVCRSTAIGDNLLFLLKEEFSSIQLCALHVEMHITEQLLASVDLLAYKIILLRRSTIPWVWVLSLRWTNYEK